MTRLTDLHGELAKETAVRWDLRSVDVHTAVETARTLRAEFIADHLHRGIQGFGRWSGLSALFSTLHRRLQRRRTLRELSQLDNRLLSDIGLSRDDIRATAAVCSERPSSGNSVWYGLASWASRELHRRETLRELSALSDEVLADIGIARAEIPAIAAALVVERPSESPAGATVDVATGVPVPAQVLAFVDLRRSLQRAANENLGRSTAA